MHLIVNLLVDFALKLLLIQNSEVEWTNEDLLGQSMFGVFFLVYFSSDAYMPNLIRLIITLILVVYNSYKHDSHLKF